MAQLADLPLWLAVLLALLAALLAASSAVMNFAEVAVQVPEWFGRWGAWLLGH